MSNNKQSTMFIFILLICIIISISLAYRKYIANENFTYFTDEESIPDRFDINSYKY